MLYSGLYLYRWFWRWSQSITVDSR